MGSAQKELSIDTTSLQGRLSAGPLKRAVRLAHTVASLCLTRLLLSQHLWSPPHSLLSQPLRQGVRGTVSLADVSSGHGSFTHASHPEKAGREPCSFPAAAS